MATDILHPPRSCGECDECCAVVAVAELNKPYHTRCVHQTGHGCTVYGNHPAECKDYACLWLQGILPEGMRPDKIGILVDAEGGNEWAVIQECRAGALQSSVGRELTNWLSGLVPHLQRGLRIEPYGAHKGISDKGNRLPGVFQQIAPKVYLYVGIDRRGHGSTGNRPPPGQVRTGRNDLCPCGSGKKFKQCCLKHTEDR